MSHPARKRRAGRTGLSCDGNEEQALENLSARRAEKFLGLERFPGAAPDLLPRTPNEGRGSRLLPANSVPHPRWMERPDRPVATPPDEGWPSTADALQHKKRAGFWRSQEGLT